MEFAPEDPFLSSLISVGKRNIQRADGCDILLGGIHAHTSLPLHLQPPTVSVSCLELSTSSAPLLPLDGGKRGPTTHGPVPRVPFRSESDAMPLHVDSYILRLSTCANSCTYRFATCCNSSERGSTSLMDQVRWTDWDLFSSRCTDNHRDRLR